MGMDSAQLDAATHQAYYQSDTRRIKLLVFKNSEGWFYQVHDLDSGEFKNTPVPDWISGRTFAKQALEQALGERVDNLSWNVIPNNA